MDGKLSLQGFLYVQGGYSKGTTDFKRCRRLHPGDPMLQESAFGGIDMRVQRITPALPVLHLPAFKHLL
jgi:hypothetical protein